MCAAALAGDIATARERNDRLLGLHRSLFVEANPIPVKWALAEMGLIENELRLPLVPLSPQYHETVRAALREAGCLMTNRRCPRMMSRKFGATLRALAVVAVALVARRLRVDNVSLTKRIDYKSRRARRRSSCRPT